MKLHLKKLIPLALLPFFVATAFGQGTGSTLLTVNGAKITNVMLNESVNNAVAEGAKDTPELRQTILNDLILREAISQDAKKTGLLTMGDNAHRLKLAQQNAILELWFAQYFKKNPVTENDIYAEYDKQVEISKDLKSAKEYLVAQILVADEVTAVDLIKKINSGTPFDELAKTNSLDKTSGLQGGVVGWILPNQLIPLVSEVVPNLSKGQVSQSAIKTVNGWHIIKVQDIRPFVIPSFDQSKNAIVQRLVQLRRQEAANALMQSVKVVKSN
jgi:peptidyl-prolyl cis-trans isomerase C